MRRQAMSVALMGALLLLVSALVAPSVAADAVYHTERLILLPVGGTPHGTGLVVNIHPNGPQVYAHERYVLRDALPNTTYTVNLTAYPFDPSCSGSPAPFGSTALRTNAAGNGTAHLVIPFGAVPLALRNATHGVAWTVTLNGTTVYRTNCTQVTLD